MAIFLRFVDEHDSEDILRWRNDPETVAASPSGAVEPSAHAQWYNQKLRDTSCHQFIVQDELHKIGVVRFDCDGKKAEVSITINPELRGRGYGKLALHKALGVYFSNFPAESVIAKIVEENARSVRLFSSCGFQLTGRMEKFNRTMLVMSLHKQDFVF